MTQTSNTNSSIVRWLLFIPLGLFVVFFSLLFLSKTCGFYIFSDPPPVYASTIYYQDGKAEIGKFSNVPVPLAYRKKALYFREHIRRELKGLFSEEDKNGKLKYSRPDGKAWDMNVDGLKIYTTLDQELQKEAEAALKTHLAIMQPQFANQLKGLKRYPYRDLSSKQVAKSMIRAKKGSSRYRNMNENGASLEEINNAFLLPTKMKVFSWNGDIDTMMTPRDSIIYYKTFLRGGMISVEPQTGFVKAWVGGADINHFSYDCVGQARRQMGSTIKPFVFAVALAMGAVEPCETFSGGYCVGDWCPSGNVVGSFASGLMYNRGVGGSSSVAVMSKMGPIAGKENIARFLRDVDIELPQSQVTPPMCLGTMSVGLKEVAGAYCSLANDGVYNPPQTILRIEDRLGNIIYEVKQKAKEVLNENVAYTITSILEGTVNQGTAMRLRRDKPYGNIIYPTAGKTGTTQNNSDAWFFGMTPDLVTGVWTGGEERAIRWGWTGMGQGASAALPMYGYFMNRVYKNPNISISRGDFPRPVDFDKAWPHCLEGNPLIPVFKGDSIRGLGGDYHFYKEPIKSDQDNPFL